MRVTIIRAHDLFDSNSYLLSAGDGFVLIDTGVVPRRASLVSALERAGCHPGELKLILLTHVHTDHVGNAAFLREAYRAPIAVHQAEAHTAEHGDMFWRPRHEPLRTKAARRASALLGIARFDPFVPDVVFADEDDLGPFGLDATVFHTPGHSPGSLCVVTAEHECFCGDLVRNSHGRPQRNRVVEVRAAYQASLARLRELPVAMIYPGHGEPFASDDLASLD